MRDVTKAQITIGLLAYFATIWDLVLNLDYSNLVNAAGVIILQLVVILVLSYVILAILEWVRIFDLKTNSILTLLVLVTVRILSSL
ncbi:hypothetical protein MBGDF03_00793 [Thermoplasmatales archaeon SCGC AB-540-F20]|nr:hypothetical protein MBGDF03_00793 [Thermoplasmatales archaeon SCGC AB-540-F20]